MKKLYKVIKKYFVSRVLCKTVKNMQNFKSQLQTNYSLSIILCKTIIKKHAKFKVVAILPWHLTRTNNRLFML